MQVRHHSCFLATQHNQKKLKASFAEAHAAIRTQLAARQPLLEAAAGAAKFTRTADRNRPTR